MPGGLYQSVTVTCHDHYSTLMRINGYSGST
jgi:hypothetical protein